MSSQSSRNLLFLIWSSLISLDMKWEGLSLCCARICNMVGLLERFDISCLNLLYNSHSGVFSLCFFVCFLNNVTQHQVLWVVIKSPDTPLECHKPSLVWLDSVLKGLVFNLNDSPVTWNIHLTFQWNYYHCEMRNMHTKLIYTYLNTHPAFNLYMVWNLKVWKIWNSAILFV